MVKCIGLTVPSI